MGKMSDLMIQVQEKEAGERLAKILDISLYELIELEYEIEIDENKDGLIYYRIEFSQDCSKEILSKIHRLENGCRVYLNPWELDDEYNYEKQFGSITGNKDFLEKYKEEITNLESLAYISMTNAKLKSVLNRQIFIGIIGTMETFLSDVFINLTFDNDIYFKNFIQTHPEFGKRKFELKEIFEQSEKLNETAKKIMLDTIYHNLPTVRQMYRDTFEIDFPKIKDIYKYVLKRHDLVYRNGKTKAGEVVIPDEKSIKELISIANEFIYGIAKNLNL